MPDAMERVLQLVAQGRLSPDDAEPILAALEAREENASDEPAAGRSQVGDGSNATVDHRPGRFIRLAVSERGRDIVNLRLPASLGSLGMMGLPGLSDANLRRVRAALEAGVRGPIVEVADEDGDGVRIVIE